MIAYLHGELKTKSSEQIVIDIHGVGYLVFIPLSTFYQLPEVGKEVRLFISTVIRDSSWQLFGFCSIEEKELFELMLGVSKIGPRLARNILSHISAEELRLAILSQDVARVRSVPGIGDKTARRLILELKDKVFPKREDANSITAAGSTGQKQTTEGEEAKQPEVWLSDSDRVASDAVEALISLGYSRLQAERAVNQVIFGAGEQLSIEELIKKALNRLAG
ncbi:MAG: Holliday junction branch migration protein RuvA [bacterium]|nr:Holliday junction branch migration protein RuvA [bacterium]